MAGEEEKKRGIIRVGSNRADRIAGEDLCGRDKVREEIWGRGVSVRSRVYERRKPVLEEEAAGRRRVGNRRVSAVPGERTSGARFRVERSKKNNSSPPSVLYCPLFVLESLRERRDR